MRRFLTHKSVPVLAALALVVSFLGGIVPPGVALASSGPPPNTKSHFCANLGKLYIASAGAEMYCFGPQPNGPAAAHKTSLSQAKSSFGANVDAANPAEDVSPAGAQSYGQSETSIAATGSYVVEAWNDATSFFSNCGSPMFKEEATGYGFSADGGKSFTDEGGLPNTNCNAATYVSDPSVEAWSPGGTAYFYISGMYDPVFSSSGPPPDNRSFIALSACKATGTASSASISCSQPILVAASSQCINEGGGFFACTFLDKDFMTIDPVRGRLYISYTEFGVFGGNTIDLSVCDIGTSTGGTGPAGGTAGAPVCSNGSLGSEAHPSKTYFVVAPNDVHNCENEGSYPAVDISSGDVYVAYEHNIGTSILGPPGSPCFSEPLQNVVNYIPFPCLTLTAFSKCGGPAATNGASVTSLEAAMIPGYNKFPMNDFPRIAVSDPTSTVSIVWNDARYHPAGDILMQSFNLTSLSAIQATPVRINSSSGGWHMLPGLRNVNQKGNLNIVFYGRSSPTTAVTNVYAALNVSPLTTSTPGNTLVTTAPTNWLAVSSDIVPNFGDYTDSYTIATSSAPFTGQTVYAAWSDGRLGDPQPFEAHT